MKEVIMEYGGIMIGVVGTISFLMIMKEVIWGADGLLPQLVRIGVGGGI